MVRPRGTWHVPPGGTSRNAAGGEHPKATPSDVDSRAWCEASGAAALRYRVAGAEAMVAHLRHHLTAMTSPSASLGIVPLTAARRTLVREGFHIFDDELVHMELLTAQVTVTPLSEIAQYVKVFQELREPYAGRRRAG